jgi:hypothetical protein
VKPTKAQIKARRKFWMPKRKELPSQCASCPFRTGNDAEFGVIVQRLKGAPAFIHRSAHLPGGILHEMRRANGLPPIEVPRHVAGWMRLHATDNFLEVTWKEVNASKTARQLDRLELKRRGGRVLVPAQVWTFLVSGSYFSGWWCYIRTVKGSVHGGGMKGEVPAGSKLAEHLMREIPLGLPPGKENFGEWMEALAKEYPRTKTRKDRRRAGIVNGWWDGQRWWREKPC